MSDPTYTDSGILRQVLGAAQRAERVRILDQLAETAAEYERRAADQSRRPAVTGWGKQAAGLRNAIEIIDKARGGWSDPPAASVVNECDAVELWASDPYPIPAEEGEEPMPVRLVVCDGADDTTASAYLSLDDADQVAAELRQLVDRIRAARAARSAAEGGASS